MRLIDQIKKWLPDGVKSKIKLILSVRSSPSNIAKVKNLITKAKQAQQAQNWSREIELRKQILELAPSDHRSAIAMIQASRKLDGLESAIELTEKFIEVFPSVAGVWREGGKNFLKNDPSRAINYWSKAWELEPDHAGTGTILMRLQLLKDQLEEAKELANSLIEKHPNNDRVVAQAIRTYIRCREFRKAESLVLTTLDQDPNNEILQDAFGRIAIGILETCTQSRDGNGQPTPIDLKHRPNFLSNPSKQFEAWNSSASKALLDEFRNAFDRSSKGDHQGTQAEKVLFVSHYNWSFMQGIISSMESNCKVRTLEFNDIPVDERWDAIPFSGKLFQSIRSGKPLDPAIDPSRYYKRLIDDSDVVYVEWCNYPAVWLSYMLPPEKKLVIRLHSYEAFTFWPHLVNWSNVDDVVFVADHIRNFMHEQIDIAQFGTKIHTIFNYNDLTKYDRPKKESAQKTIGMIGYNNANKNPIFALEVLKHLIAKDPSWRLRLVGHDWPQELSSQAEENYKINFDQVVKESGIGSNIDRVGFTQDVAGEVENIGFIISASEREGTHEVIIQAMGGGTIPVIRDWPMMNKWGGATTLYDKQWMIDSAEEAANFILDIEQNNEFELMSAKAKKEAFSKYDKTVVMPKLRAVINA